MPPSPVPGRPMSALEWAMLIALSALWGASFFFNDIAVSELPVLTTVVARVFLAALILLAVLRATGHRLPTNGRVWRAFFGMGLLNNVLPFLLIVWGQQYVASSLASILNASTPLFGVVFAHLLTVDEKMTGNRLLGVAIGFLGVAVMVGPGAFEGLGTEVVAQLVCLAGAVSYALAGIYGRRFRALGVAPMTTAAGQVVASSILLVPLMLLVDRPWTLPMPSTEALGALLGVAVLSTALAYTLYFRILATAGATNLLLVTFLIPVSATLLGVLFLGESLLARHLAGALLIGLGLAAIDGRPGRALRRRLQGR